MGVSGYFRGPASGTGVFKLGVGRSHGLAPSDVLRAGISLESVLYNLGISYERSSS